MVRTSKSRKSPAPPSSNETPKTDDNGKMVLRTRRPSQKLKEADIELSNPRSAKKPKTAAKKKVAKIDGDKPKKPPTAFFYFLEDFRKDFQEQNPDVKSMRDIGKACGEKWKSMTYEEKVHYYDVATEKRAEFDKAMAEYIRRKESGEDMIAEEESEYDE